MEIHKLEDQIVYFTQAIENPQALLDALYIAQNDESVQDVLVENALFATLDPTVRKTQSSDGCIYT